MVSAPQNLDPLKWYNSILRYCFKLTKNTEDAKDLCQQTYAIYYEKGYSGGSVLYRIAMHQFLNYQNSVVGRSHHTAETLVPFATYDADLHDLAYFSNYIDSMGVKGSALKLFNEGYNLKEISGIQNVPVDTVKTRLFTARVHLKSIL